MASEQTFRPVARLGYSIEDLESFLEAGERRLADLAAEIAVAEARRDGARQRSAEAAALRRRIAEEWLQSWRGGNLGIHDAGSGS